MESGKHFFLNFQLLPALPLAIKNVIAGFYQERSPYFNVHLNLFLSKRAALWHNSAF